MNPDSKRLTIYPSQFIEDLIKFHDENNPDSILLNIKKFQKTVDELKAKYEIPFEYMELVNYAKRFNRRFIIVEEMEIHIQHSGFEKLRQHLAWYNKMYKSNECIVNGYISNTWKKLK